MRPRCSRLLCCLNGSSIQPEELLIIKNIEDCRQELGVYANKLRRKSKNIPEKSLLKQLSVDIKETIKKIKHWSAENKAGNLMETNDEPLSTRRPLRQQESLKIIQEQFHLKLEHPSLQSKQSIKLEQCPSIDISSILQKQSNDQLSDILGSPSKTRRNSLFMFRRQSVYQRTPSKIDEARFEESKLDLTGVEKELQQQQQSSNYSEMSSEMPPPTIILSQARRTLSNNAVCQNMPLFTKLNVSADDSF